MRVLQCQSGSVAFTLGAVGSPRAHQVWVGEGSPSSSVGQPRGGRCDPLIADSGLPRAGVLGLGDSRQIQEIFRL